MCWAMDHPASIRPLQRREDERISCVLQFVDGEGSELGKWIKHAYMTLFSRLYQHDLWDRVKQEYPVVRVAEHCRRKGLSLDKPVYVLATHLLNDTSDPESRRLGVNMMQSLDKIGEMLVANSPWLGRMISEYNGDYMDTQKRKWTFRDYFKCTTWKGIGPHAAAAIMRNKHCHHVILSAECAGTPGRLTRSQVEKELKKHDYHNDLHFHVNTPLWHSGEDSSILGKRSHALLVGKPREQKHKGIAEATEYTQRVLAVVDGSMRYYNTLASKCKLDLIQSKKVWHKLQDLCESFCDMQHPSKLSNPPCVLDTPDQHTVVTRNIARFVNSWLDDTRDLSLGELPEYITTKMDQTAEMMTNIDVSALARERDTFTKWYCAFNRAHYLESIIPALRVAIEALDTCLKQHIVSRHRQHWLDIREEWDELLANAETELKEDEDVLERLHADVVNVHKTLVQNTLNMDLLRFYHERYHETASVLEVYMRRPPPQVPVSEVSDNKHWGPLLVRVIRQRPLWRHGSSGSMFSVPSDDEGLRHLEETQGLGIPLTALHQCLDTYEEMRKHAFNTLVLKFATPWGADIGKLVSQWQMLRQKVDMLPRQPHYNASSIPEGDQTVTEEEYHDLWHNLMGGVVQDIHTVTKVPAALIVERTSIMKLPRAPQPMAKTMELVVHALGLTLWKIQCRDK